MRILIAMALFARAVLAAGTVVQSTSQLGQTGNWVVAFSWTGDSSTGAVPTTAWSGQGQAGPACCQGYLIVQVETVPGSPSPTSGYAVAINDTAGVDALGGAAGSLSASAAQSFAASSAAPPVQGTLSLVITGQNVASAKGTVYVFLAKPGTVNLAKLGGNGIASAANWFTLANVPFVDARAYNFTPQSPGGSLAAGSNVITMRTMPAGITSAGAGLAYAGGPYKHYLYIKDGTGTAEAVPITAWSASTVTVTCAGTHTGNWSIQSASGGVQEAIEYAFANAMSVRYYGSAFNQGNTKSTNVNIYGPVYTPPGWGNTIDFRGVNFTVLLTSALTAFDAWTFDTFDFSHYYIGSQIYWPSQPNGSAIFRLIPQNANGEAVNGIVTSTLEFGVIVPALANGSPGTQGYGIRISSLTPSSVISGLRMTWQQINGGQYGVYIDNPTSTFGFNGNSLQGYASGQSAASYQIGTSNAGSALLFGNVFNFTGYAATTAGFISYGRNDTFTGSFAGGGGDAFQLKAGSSGNSVYSGGLRVGGSALVNSGTGNRLFLSGATSRTVLSVGASPWTYQNLTGIPLSVMVSGATISQIGLSSDNITYDNNASPGVNTYVTIQPDMYLRVTYTGSVNAFGYQ